MREGDWLAWIASLPAAERDAALEARLGIEAEDVSSAQPAPGLIGYHASGIAAIAHMILEVSIDPDDVVIDLGSGLGKVALLTHLVTGARVRGIELQAGLVERAAKGAARAGANDVTFVEGDARTADISDGTVFFLYLPFTGSVLRAVMERVRDVAATRPIVVAALGLDLDHECPWLERRSVESFWLAVYDVRGTTATRKRVPRFDRALLEIVASDAAPPVGEPRA